MEPTDVSVDEEPYNSVTGLARAVLRDLTQGTGDASRRVLAEVEAILSSSAPPAARNLLIVGFVEDVQNAALNDGIGLEVWKPLLGPLTLEAWVAVDDFWQRRITPERFGLYVETGEPTSRSES